VKCYRFTRDELGTYYAARAEESSQNYRTKSATRQFKFVQKNYDGAVSA